MLKQIFKLMKETRLNLNQTIKLVLDTIQKMWDSKH